MAHSKNTIFKTKYFLKLFFLFKMAIFVVSVLEEIKIFQLCSKSFWYKISIIN